MRYKALVADGVGFEPTNPCGLAVFKTAALNRSATHPAAQQCRPKSTQRSPVRPMDANSSVDASVETGFQVAPCPLAVIAFRALVGNPVGNSRAALYAGVRAPHPTAPQLPECSGRRYMAAFPRRRRSSAVEQLIRNQQALGSSPSVGTINSMG
jgi:hypothetical protein